MPSLRRKFGDQGEALSAVFLEQQGYVIIERNFLVREGEIDLIARKDDELVFVEVKTRRSKRFGEISESITSQKEERFFQAIDRYLEQVSENDPVWRADVITVDLSVDPPLFDHFENAFS